MNILAIETSTDACSVALLTGTDLLVDHRIAAQQHGSIVLPMIDALMSQASIKPAQLSAVAFGRGPGSFTGVRIGVALTQGIALGADVGVVGISTMHSVAQGVHRLHNDGTVAVSLDARMDEVYHAVYQVDENGLMQALTDECICPPGEVPQLSKSLDATWAGSGAERYADILQSQYDVTEEQIRFNAWPQANDLIELAKPDVRAGNLVPAEEAMPVYLRNKVAETTEERSRRAAK